MINLYCHAGSENHGCEAIVRSTKQILKKEMRLYSIDPEQDRKYHLDKEVEIVNSMPDVLKKPSVHYYVAALGTKLKESSIIESRYRYKRLLSTVQKGDVYLSIGGDNYCYPGVEILGDLNCLLHKRGVKTVLWGCSIEESRMTPSVIHDLKQYDLITARESLTLEALGKKGVINNVARCVDSAFILDKTTYKLPLGIESNRLIGINISPLVVEYGTGNMVMENYVQLLRYIITQTKYQVLLIPHVVWKLNDDRTVLKQLYNMFKESKRVYLLDDFNCMELKGAIAQCRMFVGARTHATIAAYSSCVPTLVAGYSIKARGIAIDLFGTEKHYVVPVQAFKDKNDLVQEFHWLEKHESEIRSHLQNIMPEYKNRAFESKKLLEQI